MFTKLSLFIGLNFVMANVPIEQTELAIESKTFMLKYGIFMLAGFMSALGTISFYNYKSVQSFAKYLVTSMVATLSIGIILFELFDYSIEVCFAISLFSGLFLKYIIDNLIIMINKVPTYSDQVSEKVVEKVSEKVEKSFDSSETNNQ